MGEVWCLLNVAVRAYGSPAIGVGGGTEEGEGGGADDAGEVTGAGIVADQRVGGAEVIEQLDVSFGFDNFGDGGEMIQVFLGQLLALDFADQNAHVVAAFDELADELDEVLGRPAFSRCAAAGVDADRAGGGAFVPDAALRDRAHDLIDARLDDLGRREVVVHPLGDVTGEGRIIGRARLDVDELRFGGDGADRVAPCIAGRGDEGVNRVGNFQRFARGLGQGGGSAEEVGAAG